MSRRSNNVRGPTSALTEFLRESGINPETIARRVATRDSNQGQNVAVQGAEHGGVSVGAVDEGGDGPDRGEDEDETPARPAASTNPSRISINAGYVSDQLDDVEEESPVKKRKSTRNNMAKAKAKKKAKDDGDYQGSSEDEYTALSKRLMSMGGNGNPKPPVGSFENCARCGKQFTVTKYTIVANPPPGYLCHQCAKSSGVDPFKKPAARKKRKPAAEKREVVSFEQRRLPTLASLCIELIGKFIDDVEALGGIGSVNMDEIAKTLARNRSLTPVNAQLFYDVKNERLRFYDATNLGPSDLRTLASLNPNLTHLHLDFCGRLTCPVVDALSKSLPYLTHLTLLGPFLVRAETWTQFFKVKPKLRSFCITQSPRFDLECATSLAENCSELEELKLKEIGLMNDTFAEPFCTLPPLKLLDLSDPGTSISEDGWLRILEKHGPMLETFDASRHEGFTDLVLENGIRRHCRVLSELKLEGLSSLSDAGVAYFFENWNKPFVTLDDGDDDDASEDAESKMNVDDGCITSASVSTSMFKPNPPLRIVSLTRNYTLGGAALTALLAHSALSLVSLNLNGLGPMSPESLARLKDAVEVQWLNVSWCREMDDFIMQDVVSSAPKLEEVRVWGCNRVRGTGWAGKKGLKVFGIEPNAGAQ